MFDSLREQTPGDQPAGGKPALSGGSSFDAEPESTPSAGSLLGMTPAQRLIIAVLLLAAVCVLGTMCLLVTGRIGLG